MTTMNNAESLSRAGNCLGKFIRVQLQIARISTDHGDALARPGPGGHWDIGVDSVDTSRVLSAIYTVSTDDNIGTDNRR